MKLKNKIILIFALSITVSLIAIFAFTRYSFYNHFKTIEYQNIFATATRLKKVIINEQKMLTLNGNGYSTWDDAYNFVNKPNQKFIQDSFLTENIYEQQMDQVFIFNRNKKILFSKQYDLINKKTIDLKEELVKELFDNYFQYLDFNSTIAKTGLFIINNELYLATINPILKTIGEGDNNGLMIFTRKFDKNFLKRYDSINSSHITFEIKSNPTRDIFILPIEEIKDNLLVRIYFPDLSSRSTVILNYPFSKVVINSGLNALFNFSVIMLAALVFIAIAIYFIFDFYVVRKIIDLQKELAEISDHQDNSKKISNNYGEDEIGSLAKYINNTLSEIENKQRLINQTSKFSALGEMAGSIAHEINNPLTVVSISSKKIDNLIKFEVIDRQDLSKCVQKIINSTNRIDKIVKSLKLVSRSADNDPFS